MAAINVSTLRMTNSALFSANVFVNTDSDHIEVGPAYPGQSADLPLAGTRLDDGQTFVVGVHAVGGTTIEAPETLTYSAASATAALYTIDGTLDEPTLTYKGTASV